MTQEKLQALAVALHRKLLNINHDVRKLRNSQPTKESLAALVAKRKAVDLAYSRCMTHVNCPDQKEQERIYTQALHTYITH